MGLFDNSNILARLKKSAGGSRPPLEGFYIYILAMFLGFVVADLATLEMRPAMLPKEAPPAKPENFKPKRVLSLNDYGAISSRNIFNRDGKIPPPLSEGDPNRRGIEAAPVLSQLPLILQGTIVHANPNKSVATVEIKNRNEVLSFKVGEEMDHIAHILKIERRKVTFRNTNNSRLEYIEIPEDGALTLGVKAPKAGTEGTIEKAGEFEFTLRRNILDKYTSDLTSILSQARMLPNIAPGGGGQIDGFKFVAIEPGSIYEALGFKVGDTIKSVEGEPVNSPTKAMELYNQLRTANRVSIGVERDGRSQQFNYQITE